MIGGSGRQRRREKASLAKPIDLWKRQNQKSDWVRVGSNTTEGEVVNSRPEIN